MITVSQQIENFNKEQKLYVRKPNKNSRVGKHNYWIKNSLEGLKEDLSREKKELRDLKIGQLRWSSPRNRKKKEWRKMNLEV